MRGLGSYGPEYHQDRVPVRKAQVVEGHAVRQLYLTAGATDYAMESGDDELMAAMQRLWHDLAARKTLPHRRVWRAPHGRILWRRLRAALARPATAKRAPPSPG